jgi:broad specificity phosphatase PhoE
VTASLFLVRHGRPLTDPSRPASDWPLDPAGLADVDALAGSGRLPTDADWFSSSERKAVDTAARLAESRVTVLDPLREHRREARWFDDPAEFRVTVRRAFEHPEKSAVAEWEPLAQTSDRLLPAVRRILAKRPGRDVVLVGHGTAWTLLAAELTGRPADLDAWARLAMPDLWVLPRAVLH